MPAGVRDWRAGHDKDMGELAFEPYALPDKIARQCVVLTRQLGLPFGAIDLVQDDAGETWFLEINPNGQWAFVDKVTADKIGKAIAQMLERGK